MKRFLALGLAPLLAAVMQISAVQASGTPAFNGIDGDQPTLTASTDGSTFATSVNAEAGKTVYLQVWDHNSVIDTTANNVKIKVGLPTGFSTSQTVTASISADNAQPVNGSVTISTGSQPVKVDYVSGSAVLYRLDPDDSTHKKIIAAHWPAGVNPDDVIGGGVNIGDQQGCWQYAQAIILKVVLTPQGTPVPTPTPTPVTPYIQVTKSVRREGSNQDFVPSLQVNPGTKLEYQVTVRNVDASTALHNVSLKDFLPDGIAYAGYTILHGRGAAATEPDTMVSADGLTLGDLQPNETVQLSFLAKSDPNLAGGSCLKNKVVVTASNAANSPQTAYAETCFVTVVPTPVPPTPHPVTPPATPMLPRTGPESALLFSGAASGLGWAASRFYRVKSALKKSWKNIDVL